MALGWDTLGVRSRQRAEHIISALGRDEKGIISITNWTLIGSRAASCALDSSDLDIGVAICCPTDEKSCMERCRDIVVGELNGVDVAVCKRSARSPAVLKWWDSTLQCSIDLAAIVFTDSRQKPSSSSSSSSGTGDLQCAREVRNTLLIGSLCRLVKQWTYCRGLAHVLPGTLLMSLTLHYFDKSTVSDIVDHIIRDRGNASDLEVSDFQATPCRHHLEQIFSFFQHLASIANRASASSKACSKLTFTDARNVGLESWSGEARWKQEEALNDSCDLTNCDIVWVQEPASPRLMPLDVSKLAGELARVLELEENLCLASLDQKFKSAEEAFSGIICHPLFQHYASSMATHLKTYKRKFQDAHFEKQQQQQQQPVKGIKYSEELLGCDVSSSSSEEEV